MTLAGFDQNKLHAGVIWISRSLFSCCLLGLPVAQLCTSNLIMLAGSAPLRLGDYSHEAGEKHQIKQKQNNHTKMCLPALAANITMGQTRQRGGPLCSRRGVFHTEPNGNARKPPFKAGPR